MKSQNSMYVQLGQKEALQSKKDILSSELNLLKIKKRMKTYQLLRKEEIKTKLKLYRKIKEFLNNINQLQKTLPQIRIPKILKKEEEKYSPEKQEIERKIEKTKEQQYDKDLENQLWEIQKRLKELEKY